MALTDKEKQELIALIERDLPVPLHYVKKLQHGQGEAQLFWPGKHYPAFPDPPDVALVERIVPCLETDMISGALCSSARKGTSGAEFPSGWINQLIFGDNQSALSFLKFSPMAHVLEALGGIKLIYIDPPFAVGNDFCMEVRVPASLPGTYSACENFAYSDRWGGKQGSFYSMLFERLYLMHDLLAADGSLFVHCDWRSNAFVRLALEEIFGPQGFRNEIIWHYTGGGRAKKYFSKKHDTIFWFSKSNKWTFNAEALRVPYNPESGYAKGGIISASGKHYKPNPQGTLPDDVWDIPIINPLARERLGYPTQKPAALLERIIKAASHEGDLVVDFFCGSGTTLEVAERLKRRWIGVDRGEHAVHVSRKRLIQAMRERLEGRAHSQAFDLLSLCRSSQRRRPIASFSCFPQVDLSSETSMLSRILTAYGAETKLEGEIYSARKNGRAVYVQQAERGLCRLNGAVELIKRSARSGENVLDLLVSEMEIGFLPGIFEAAAGLALDLRLFRIPTGVFYASQGVNARAGFYEIRCLDLFIRRSGDSIAFELAGFWTYAEWIQRKKLKTKTQQWSSNNLNWIDYWSVDFFYGKYDESQPLLNSCFPSGSQVPFISCWQGFRHCKGKSLPQITPWRLRAGISIVALKIVDIFARETTQLCRVKAQESEA